MDGQSSNTRGSFRPIRAAAIRCTRLCAVIAICSIGLAQQPLAGRDPTQGVYVRDSAIAVEKLALAERLERLREWAKSADVYQEILSQYSDRVVPARLDNDQRIVQYTSVNSAVQTRLSKWPAEGLAVYRARFEPEAQQLLDSAPEGDLPTLHRVHTLYFVTDASLNAGIRLMDRYTVDGEFAAAAWIGNRLLSQHPSLGPSRPMILYRTAIALHLSGHAGEASKLLDQLRDKHAEAIGAIRGEDVNLAQSLERDLNSAPPVVAATGSSNSWPIPFGDASRSRVPEQVGVGGARLYSIPIAKPTYSQLAPMQRRELEQIYTNGLQTGLMTGILPVVDNGELFFHDNARVYAVSIDSGLPLPGWASTYEDGRFTRNYDVNPRGFQNSLSLTPDSVLAVLGNRDIQVSQRTGQITRDARLICLDRLTGKLKWETSTRALGDDNSPLRNVDLVGSPLVVADNVYLMGRGGRAGQFEDAYLLCFDLANGKLRWSTYLASTSTMQQFAEADSFTNAPPGSHLAHVGGRIFVQTNVGAIAAVEAFTGAIIWLNLYPRDVIDFAAGNRMMTRTPGSSSNKPWTYNPVIVRNDVVFALPADALNVHIYSAGSGEEIKRIPVRGFDSASALLAVVNDRLLLSSAHQVFCIRWQTFEPEKSLGDNIFWHTNRPTKRGVAGDSIRGRPFVSNQWVFVPFAWQMTRHNLQSGLTVESYPASGNWDQFEGAGNILVTQDHLVIASPAQIAVYTDLRAATVRLDAEIAQAPTDSELPIKYADLLFVAGDTRGALNRIDQAIQIAGGRESLRTSRIRDRLFASSLAFAEKLAERGIDGEVADAFYDRASWSAASAPQQVTWRLSRADYARQSDNVEFQIQLLQEILADPQLRAVTSTRGNAAQLAQRHIDDLIRRRGAQVYAHVEQESANQLDVAMSQNDPVALLEVAQRYPNSMSSRQALIAAAEAYESGGKFREATQTLRQFLLRHPDATERPMILESLARNYLNLPNRVEMAMSRLAQGARSGQPYKLTKPLTLPDGQILNDVGFSEALAALRKVQVQQAAGALVNPGIPQGSAKLFEPPRPAVSIANVTALLTPAENFERNDRIVAVVDGKLAVIETGGGAPLWLGDPVNGKPSFVGWIEGNLLIADVERAVLYAGDTGEKKFDFSVRNLPIIDVVSPDALSRADELDRLVAPHGDPSDGATRIVVVPPDARKRGMRPDIAELAVQPVPPAARNIALARPLVVNVQPMDRRGEAARVAANRAAPASGGAEKIDFVAPISDRILLATSFGRVIAISPDGETTLWQTRLVDRPFSRFEFNDDFAVLSTGDDVESSLLAIDTFNGQVVYRYSASVTDTTRNRPPVNFGLAADGTLVVVLPDTLIGKDLFDSSGALRFNVSVRDVSSRPALTGATNPDHLLIADGRILIVAESGLSVRVHSLETGRILKNERAELRLPAGTGNNWQVKMRLLGSRLYTMGVRSVHAYDLDRVTNPQLWKQGDDGSPALRDLVLVQDAAISINEPASAAPQIPPNRPLPGIRVRVYSRQPVADAPEAGLLTHDVLISDAAGVTAWQVVDGGFYYLSANNTLHFMKGAQAK